METIITDLLCFALGVAAALILIDSCYLIGMLIDYFVNLFTN